MSKKKEMYMTMGAVFVAVYIFLVFYIIHVKFVMYMDPRLSFIDALSTGASHMMTEPFGAMPPAPGTFATIGIITIVLGAIGFMLINDQLLRAHYNPDTVNGAAKWLTDLKEYDKRFTEPFGKPTHEGKGNMILSQDILLSMMNEKTRRNENIFVVGGSGSGKSYNLVGPNLMQANCSYVITDPSGGLYKKYGNFFEYNGYKVKCFNLNEMDKSSHYNPFHYIHSDKDIQILVTTLITNTTPPDQHGGDPFWEKSETALLVAIIAYLYHHHDKEDQNFESVMRLLRCAQINENDSSTKSPLDYMFAKIEAQNPEDFAVKQYKTFKMGAGKTLQSILISCAVRLQAFDLREVADLTRTDDIDLEYVGDEKTALFIILPTGEKTFNFLASMMYSQLFQRSYAYCETSAEFSQLVMDGNKELVRTFRASNSEDSKRAQKEADAFLEKAKKAKIIKSKEFNWYEIRTIDGDLVTYRLTEDMAKKALESIQKGFVMPNNKQSNDGQRLPIHVRMMLDEFANCGKIPGFSQIMATCRKYDLSATIIVQSVGQMKTMYDKEADTIIGNCDTMMFLGTGNDFETLEWVSKLLGKETRVVMNVSYSKGGGNTSLNRQGVELFSPDQLRTLPENECIVIQRALSAFKGRKYDPNKHPNKKVVDDINHEKGSFFFDAKKAKTLYSVFHKYQEIEKKEEKNPHGEVRKDSEEEKKKKQKREEARQQAQQEYKNNEGADGKPVVEKPSDVKGPGENLAKQLNMMNAKKAKEAEKKSKKENDNSFPISSFDGNSMMFGSHPATSE